jgi:hypothetical protein
LYEIQRWSATSGGVLILVEDVAELRLCAVDDGEEDDLVFLLARFLKQSNRYVALGWAVSGLCRPASAGVVLGCDEEVSLVSFPSLFSFKFLFCFSIFLFEIKFEFCVNLQVLKYVNLNRT